MTSFWALVRRDLRLAVREGGAIGTALGPSVGGILIAVAVRPLTDSVLLVVLALAGLKTTICPAASTNRREDSPAASRAARTIASSSLSSGFSFKPCPSGRAT